jgi:Nif-specific regulatory protein
VSIAPHSLSPASLTALTEAAAAISSTLDLDSVLQTIARLARTVTHAEASSLLLLDTSRAQLVIAAATGTRREALVGRVFPADLGLPGHVVRTAAPILLPDARAHARFCREIDDLGSPRTRSLIGAPLVHRGEVIGVIQVVNRVDEADVDDSDLKILQVFATLAATAAHNAREHQDLKRRFEALRDSISRDSTIIGRSALLRAALDLCERVAPSSATVLILGETGTGKELCARHIHKASRRAHEAFVAINCAALPETLLESELFGHEKGGFTGAHAQRKGWFELASGGTLFLDEIGDISRSTQAKLLRVIQEKEFVRVGGTEAVSCDVRLITATNRNLKHMMLDGLFREDLYYRLSVFPISTPALRDRPEDIPLLVEHFIQRSASEFGIPSVRVHQNTLEALGRYSWPGNIRELQNVIERSVLLNDGDVLLSCHLPPDIQAAAGAGAPAQGREAGTLHGQERALILKALMEQNWNQSRAARALGITRDHLRHRIKKYQIERPVDHVPL